tara:strand:+ start:778 stop:1101 length:324 start_codon:yes stop_codon:yes gene_type:complete
MLFQVLVNEDGEEVLIVLTHVSKTGSGKEEIKLLFCFLVGFYQSSSDRLFNSRFESKSSFFIIAGFFGFIWAFIRGNLFLNFFLLDLFVMLLFELLFEFLLKLAIFL